MKTKEEILAKRIIRFPAGDRRLAAGAMTDEAIKRNVYAAMEEYAAQFKDSPYQAGSAGVWRSAASPAGDGWVSVEDGLPEVGEYVLVYNTEGATLIARCLLNGWAAYFSDGERLMGELAALYWRKLPSPPNKSV